MQDTPPPPDQLRQTILAMRAGGASAAQIAYALREIGARTASGGDWTQRMVLALIARAAKAPASKAPAPKDRRPPG